MNFSKVFVFIMVLVALMLIVPMAFASTTDGPEYTNDLGWGNGVRDYTGDHDHEYNDNNTQRSKKWRVELGADIIVQDWKN